MAPIDLELVDVGPGLRLRDAVALLPTLLVEGTRLQVLTVESTQEAVVLGARYAMDEDGIGLWLLFLWSWPLIGDTGEWLRFRGEPLWFRRLCPLCLEEGAVEGFGVELVDVGGLGLWLRAAGCVTGFGVELVDASGLGLWSRVCRCASRCLLRFAASSLAQAGIAPMALPWTRKAPTPALVPLLVVFCPRSPFPLSWYLWSLAERVGPEAG